MHASTTFKQFSPPPGLLTRIRTEIQLTKTKRFKPIGPSAFRRYHTRHTPRDFLQLLSYIQKCSSRKKVEVGNIIAGIGQYSAKYFLPEIKDELVGYISRDKVEKILNGISSMKKRRFKTNDLANQIYGKYDFSGTPIITILETLFNCSAIGNVKSRNGKYYFSFKYRNRHANFVTSQEIFIHRGLWRAMNIV